MGKQDDPNGGTSSNGRASRSPTFLEYVALAIIVFAVVVASVLLIRRQFTAQDLLALLTAMFAGMSGMAALAARGADRKATDAENSEGGGVVDDAHAGSRGRAAAEGGDA